MHAVVARQAGGPEVLSYTELPEPTPGPGQLLIRVAAAGVTNADEVRRLAEPLARAGEGLRGEMRELRAFLFAHLYRHPAVAGVNGRSRALLEGLFRHFMAHPQDLGTVSREMIATEGLPRCVADYLAGMTDRYIVEAAKKFGIAGE